MQESGVEESSEESVVDEPGGDHPANAPTGLEQSSLERMEASSEHEELLAKVHWLEAELERYREHAQRTSKLFHSATNFAEWVRERARRDAELALRKAASRVEKLTETARDLERTEDELVRLKDELARLQALTDETRTRLSAFLTAGLQVLNAEVGPAQADGSELDDLEDTLHRQLASTPASEPAPFEDVESPER